MGKSLRGSFAVTRRQPQLVLACLLAGQGLVFRMAAFQSHPAAVGGFLPGPFISRVLNLSSLVFFIAAIATLVDARPGQPISRNWRSLGTLVFALMALADLWAGLCLADSVPAMSRLLRILGLPISLTGAVMGLRAFNAARRGSERFTSLAGLALNGFAFMIGIAGPLILRTVV